MTQHEFSFGTIDQHNVPPGMVAVLKSQRGSNENACHFCHYRPDCIAAGGQAIPCSDYRRPDHVSVYFVRRVAG